RKNDLTSATPQDVQMFERSCAGPPLTLVSHVSQRFQVCFYPLNRSLIDAEGLLRQKKALIHSIERRLLACWDGLPATQSLQSLSSMGDCDTHLIKPHGFPKALFRLTFMKRPDNNVLDPLF